MRVWAWWGRAAAARLACPIAWQRKAGLMRSGKDVGLVEPKGQGVGLVARYEVQQGTRYIKVQGVGLMAFKDQR
jgi:hypothetical protein